MQNTELGLRSTKVGINDLSPLERNVLRAGSSFCGSDLRFQSLSSPGPPLHCSPLKQHTKQAFLLVAFLV